MYVVTVFIASNEAPIYHKYNSFRKAIRKVRQYEQSFDCTCFITCYDRQQNRYVVQRYKNGCKDTNIEFAL